MRSADVKPSVGVSTQLGVGLTVAGVATAIVAFATGDRTEQTIGTLSGAAVAILAFGITAAIRAVQAKALIVAHAPLVGTQTQSTPLHDVATEVAAAVRERLDEELSVERWHHPVLGRALHGAAEGEALDVALSEPSPGAIALGEDDEEDGDVDAGPEVEQMEVTAPDLVPPDEGDQAAHDDPAVVSA